MSEHYFHRFLRSLLTLESNSNPVITNTYQLPLALFSTFLVERPCALKDGALSEGGLISAKTWDLTACTGVSRNHSLIPARDYPQEYARHCLPLISQWPGLVHILSPVAKHVVRAPPPGSSPSLQSADSQALPTLSPTSTRWNHTGPRMTRRRFSWRSGSLSLSEVRCSYESRLPGRSIRCFT